MRNYIAIARPDHWFKNIFMLPGIALAMIMDDVGLGAQLILDLLTAIIATCAIVSANYTINEWLDAETDKFHPKKKLRPSVQGGVSAFGVYLQWILLSVIGIGLALSLNFQFTIYAIALLMMGIIYNVKPLRSKDRVHLDTLSESINNPLRFMLGWSAVDPQMLPPSSILIIYWMGGAYLMAIKRYAEFRYIGDPTQAGLYRRSFKFYSEESLLLAAFFYALTAAFFTGVFLIKYRVEYILAIPLLALLFVWYLWIGMQANSVTQNPERLYKERGFLAYLSFCFLVILVLTFVDIPVLNALLNAQLMPSF
jgi:decaprenyl-phosphate phosphoribosyltransferase